MMARLHISHSSGIRRCVIIVTTSTLSSSPLPAGSRTTSLSISLCMVPAALSDFRTTTDTPNTETCQERSAHLRRTSLGRVSSCLLGARGRVQFLLLCFVVLVLFAKLVQVTLVYMSCGLISTELNYHCEGCLDMYLTCLLQIWLNQVHFIF